MGSRPLVAVSLVALLVLSGCTVGYQTTGPAEPISEPDTDRLEAVDGYSYDDTLDVDASDGLTEAEKEAIVSRAMARIQVLRGLPFEERVPVELLTREEFQDRYPTIGERDVSEAANALDNAEYEALFLVGSDRNVAEVRAGNRGESVLGFYSPTENRIVVVSGRDPATFEDETILAHELLHALQDQQFGLGGGGATTEASNAHNGLIEGEAVLIEQRYERNCETGEWECVGVDSDGPVPMGEEFHFGVYFLSFFPYAEGPSFVEHHERRGGWEAIDAMYADPPQTTAEIVYPGTYGEQRRSAMVTDRNAGGFERIEPDDAIDHAAVGQAGLAAMFAYTLYDDYNRSAAVIEPEEFLNRDGGGLDQRRPFTYDIGYAEGIESDRLHAYERDDERAYVWRLAWNDRANATQFRDGYGELLAHWGGERIEERGDAAIWRIADDSPFAGAVWIERDGTDVTIVRAPTVDDLGDAYRPAGEAVDHGS